MRKWNWAAAVALTVLGTAYADAATITLKAVATSSIASDGYHYGDNLLRSYEQPNFTVNGYMRFDLSGIADSATINAATLTTYSDTSFNSPSGAPQSAIYLVNDDSWNNAPGGGTQPGLARKASPTYSAFPTTSGGAMNWAIDVSAVSGNLLDNLLSLAMHGEKGSYSYVYFFGAANSATAPTLTIDYSPAATSGVPEPATWAMMMLGFGGMGYAMRRRPGAAARIRFA